MIEAQVFLSSRRFETGIGPEFQIAIKEIIKMGFFSLGVRVTIENVRNALQLWDFAQLIILIKISIYDYIDY